MIITLFFIGSVLTFVLRAKKRTLEEHGGNTFTHHLINQSLDFLIPFSVVTFFFLILSFFISGTSDSTALRSLLRMEEFLIAVKEKFSVLKFSPAIIFVILLLLFALNLLGTPSARAGKIYSFIKKSQKTVKKVYIFLVILCSFSFFGMQLGEPIAELSFRIKGVREGYAHLRGDVQAAVSKEVAGRLYDSIYESFPQDYQAALSSYPEIKTQGDTLRAAYDAAKEYGGDDDPGVEGALRDDPPPRPPGEGPPSRAPDERVSRAPDNSISDYFETQAEPPAAEPDLSSASVNQVNQARAEVEAFQEGYQSRPIQFLRTEAGKDLLVQPPKIITSRIKKYFVELVADRYPILEPLLDVFVGSFDKSLETKIHESVDELTPSILRNPMQARPVIKSAVTKILESKPVKLTAAVIERAKRLADRARARLERIKGYLTKYEGRSEELMEAAGYIELLTCDRHDNRVEAADWLSAHGEQLTKSQVRQITKLLGDRERKIRLYSETGSYEVGSTYFEEIPVNYYAARALGEMESRYLNDSVRESAAEITMSSQEKFGTNLRPASKAIIDKGLG